MRLLLKVCTLVQLSIASLEVSAQTLRDEQILILDEGWLFFGGRSISPEDDYHSYDYQITQAKLWSEIASQKDKFGSSTYIREVSDLKPNTSYSLYIPSILGSAKAYIYAKENLNLAWQQELGRTDPKNFQFSKAPLKLNFNSHQYQDFVIIIQIHNYQLSDAGLWLAPQLGQSKLVEFKTSLDAFLGLLAFGIAVGVATYCLFQWALRRADKVAFWLLIVCLGAVTRNVTTSSFFLNLFSDSYMHVLYRLEFWSIPLSFSFSIFLIRSFPTSAFKYLYILSIACSLFMMSLAFIVSLSVLQDMRGIFQISVLLNTLVMFLLAFDAWRKKKDGSILVVSGVMVIILCVVFDIVVVARLRLADFFTVHLGVSIFLLMQNQLLARRTRAIYRRARYLAQQREKHELELRLEAQARIDLAAQLAHRVNNPLNYIHTNHLALLEDLKNLKEKVLCLFHEVESEEALSLKNELASGFESLESSTIRTDEYVRQAEASISTIREVSGVNGVYLTQVSLELLFEKALGYSKDALKELSGVFVVSNFVVLSEALFKLDAYLEKSTNVRLSHLEEQMLVGLATKKGMELKIASEVEIINHLLKPYSISFFLEARHLRIEFPTNIERLGKQQVSELKASA